MNLCLTCKHALIRIKEEEDGLYQIITCMLDSALIEGEFEECNHYNTKLPGLFNI